MPSSHLARSGGSGISLGRRAVVVAAVEDLVAVVPGEVGGVGGVGGGEEIRSAAVTLETIGQHKAEPMPLYQR